MSAPSGMMMMMKALGVDPEMFGKVAGAITQIAETLGCIEEKQNRILLLLGDGVQKKLEAANGRGSETTDGK